MVEFDLIARIRARAAARADVLLGIGDDAALLRPPPGQLLAVTADTLNAGVHFPQATAAADIGWKALAVNLSDLAAMGAEPAWCTLSLSLPDADVAWLDGFLDGFFALAAAHGVALIGGDTTRGPLSIAVTAHGLVPEGQALRRSGAQAGDAIWVTGTLGDAAAGLAIALAGPAGRLTDAALPDQDAAGLSALRARLDRPTPRVAAGIALRGLATACIDVSDGLLADLGHVLAASDVGARVDIARLPSSAALRARHSAPARWALQLSGGDDYELCFTAPAAATASVAAALASARVAGTIVGGIVDGSTMHRAAIDGSGIDRSGADRSTIDVRTPDGRPWTPPRTGYRHFDEG